MKEKQGGRVIEGGNLLELKRGSLELMVHSLFESDSGLFLNTTYGSPEIMPDHRVIDKSPRGPGAVQI